MEPTLLIQAKQIFANSGLKLKDQEWQNIESTDFGLANFAQVGLFVHTYINTARCCAKELILLPEQTCPEHRHPPFGDYAGKEETFCCRYGSVSLFVEGEPTAQPSTDSPELGKLFYTAWQEHVLHRGDLYTLQPNTRHWFKAHAEGAVVSEFSTHSNDNSDIFTDPAINRAARV